MSTSSGAPGETNVGSTRGPVYFQSSLEQSSTADVSGGSSTGRGSRQAMMPATASGGGGSGGAGSSAGVGGSGGQLGAAAAPGAGSLSNMLKLTPEEAMLRDLRIGPLLGRGITARVYKGRWNGVSVAVKIIGHSERSPGTASSGILRESLLAAQLSHPNIVQSYFTSTMTVSKRNALAKAWLSAEAGTSPATKQSPEPSSSAQKGGDNHGSNSSDSTHSRDKGATRCAGDGQLPLSCWLLLL
uniref:Protein kinase domain-containing protein n=1 Tax=Tetradesmus obliquus TaxID=3088 RepID=A0A383VCI5_TETOB|eukprot:jgi/Sobl393_1/8617/SZX63268.1